MEVGGPTQVSRGQQYWGGHMRPAHWLSQSQGMTIELDSSLLTQCHQQDCPAEQKHMVRCGLLFWQGFVLTLALGCDNWWMTDGAVSAVSGERDPWKSILWTLTDLSDWSVLGWERCSFRVYLSDYLCYSWVLSKYLCSDSIIKPNCLEIEKLDYQRGIEKLTDDEKYKISILIFIKWIGNAGVIEPY